MRFKLFTATSVSIMACSVAYAGGWSTGTLGQSFMSEKGGFGEISVGQVDYKITASTANSYTTGVQATNIDVIKDANRVGLSLKNDYGEKFSVGLTNFQYGSIQMQGGAGAARKSWIPDADATLNTMALLGSYNVSDGLNVLVGVRRDILEKTTVSTIKGDYTIDSAVKTRGVMGVSYQKPEIALKVSATYSPKAEISTGSSFAETSQPGGVGGISYGDAIIAQGLGVAANAGLLATVSSYTTTVGLPETLNIEFQTGIAEDTLLFGSIVDTKWKKAQIDSNGSATSRITTAFSDTVSYSLGIGRRLNDNWSITGSYKQEDGGGAYASSLFTVSNGSKGVTLAARYTNENMTVTAGVNMVEVGGVTITSDGTSTGTTYAKYGTNSAVGVGLRVSFDF
jgi:long-subunit fatty acid transport protein